MGRFCLESSLVELDLESLNRHHQGLFQSPWKPEGVADMDPFLIVFHELFQNSEWLFGLTQTKALLHVCVCVCQKTLRKVD